MIPPMRRNREEAAFFVLAFEPATGGIRLSDGTRETLAPETLRTSPIDGAWLCNVKAGLVPGGIPARLERVAQEALLENVEERAGRLGIPWEGEFHVLPETLD